jgi:hypothetical protein
MYEGDFSEYDEFHDWSVNEIFISDDKISLLIEKYDKSIKLKIEFLDLKRIVINQIFIKNIIYDMKIFDCNTTPLDWNELAKKIDEAYPIFQEDIRGKIVKIDSSIGIDALIECGIVLMMKLN